MAYSIRIIPPSCGINDYDAKHLESVSASIAHSREVLKANPPTDTFAGRKTQALSCFDMPTTRREPTHSAERFVLRRLC